MYVIRLYLEYYKIFEILRALSLAGDRVYIRGQRHAQHMIVQKFKIIL